MKVVHAMEWAILSIASAVAVVVSVAHLFGLMGNWRWLAEQIPAITLLLVASLLPILVGIIAYRTTHIQKTLSLLQESHDRILFERFSDIRSKVAPDLGAVVGHHIDDMLIRIERAVREKYFEIDDVDLFRSFYKRTLEAFPNSTFLATSLPREKYFWKNPQFERAMTDFIKRGGSMRRVFFLQDAWDLENPEVREILSNQLQMHVEVYVADWDRVPPNLRHFFAVESSGRLAWEALVGPAAEIEHVRATCDTRMTQKYVRDFNEILGLETTRRHFGSTIDAPAAEVATRSN